MKILILCLSSFVLFVSRNAVGQLMEFPDLYYKKLEFDVVHRGSYNMTDCAASLINCWEVIRPEILCDYTQTVFESICGALRNHCSDRYGQVDVKYGDQPFPLAPFACETQNVLTRRYITISRNNTKIVNLLRALNYTDPLSGKVIV